MSGRSLQDRQRDAARVSWIGSGERRRTPLFTPIDGVASSDITVLVRLDVISVMSYHSHYPIKRHREPFAEESSRLGSRDAVNAKWRADGHMLPIPDESLGKQLTQVRICSAHAQRGVIEWCFEDVCDLGKSFTGPIGFHSYTICRC